MNNTELKPCPWCGGAAEIVTLRKENYGYWPEAIGAKCQSCGATRGGFVVERYDFTAREHVDIRAKAEAKAVASWNTRATLQEHKE